MSCELRLVDQSRMIHSKSSGLIRLEKRRMKSVRGRGGTLGVLETKDWSLMWVAPFTTTRSGDSV